MIRIGINGFGRIGRAVTRQILLSKDCNLVAINELDPDIKNLGYLLKYDSIYGRFPKDIKVKDKDKALFCSGRKIKVYSHDKTEQVPWEKHAIDVLIDATGVRTNVVASRNLVKARVPKIVITHSPPESDIDFTFILGVNETEYDPKRHRLISSSICDATAIAPVLYEINRKWGVESAFVTTLHPWLSYQNLLDGFLSSVASPGHFWKDYSLGRNSALNLIPKDTTAAAAVLKVLPELKNKLDAISFRVPTNIVSASDLSILVKFKTTADEVNSFFKLMAKKKNDIFELQEDFLVSSDHLGTSKSAVIDSIRTKVLDSRFIKMVIWYDNEWGYSSKVVQIAKFVSSKRK